MTGSTGSAGRAILRRLLAAGSGPLFGTYRSDPSPAFLAEFAGPLAAGRLRLLRQELAELAPSQGPDADAVVHCAARRLASRCAADPAAAFRDNIEAVHRLVAWSRRRGAGLFLHCSIHSLYADGPAPYRESDPVRATDLQAATKLESEAIVAQGLGAEVRHVILRLPHFYGAGLPCDGVMAAFARAASTGELRISGDGEQTVCFLELGDLAGLISALLENPPPTGIYNAASETIRVKALAERFQKAWREGGKGEPAIRVEGGPQPRSFGLDCGKLFAATSWRPNHLVEEVLHALAAHAEGDPGRSRP